MSDHNTMADPDDYLCPSCARSVLGDKDHVYVAGVAWHGKCMVDWGTRIASALSPHVSPLCGDEAARLRELEEAGVWVVAHRYWDAEGPGKATPYPDEIAAMRAANADQFCRAWFVPFGKDLSEVMNEH
ncbi:hypothetical protein [Nocardia sp. NPDC046763]|uniref:hypothetical protein n=1 Tax=Nocardia sp. NPDC046763 TaxID=3155256 RepID=UPI0033C4F97D